MLWMLSPVGPPWPRMLATPITEPEAAAGRQPPFAAQPSTVPAAQMVGRVGAPWLIRAGASVIPLITTPVTTRARSTPRTYQVQRCGLAKARVVARVQRVSAPRKIQPATGCRKCRYELKYRSRA